MHVAHLQLFLIIFTLLLISGNAELLHSIRNYFTLFNNHHNATTAMAIAEGKHEHFLMNKGKELDKREVTDENQPHVCNDNQLMAYLAAVEIVNPENIINLATAQDLKIVCNKISDALTEIETYLNTCKILDTQDLYIQLIRGMARFVDVMCETETKIKKRFMQNAVCLQDLHEDFENCYGPADWTEDIKKKDICCAFGQIADCYYTKAAEVCGVKAAEAMRKVVTTIINAVIPVRCSILIKPCVTDLAATATSQKLEQPNLILITSSLICTLIMKISVHTLYTKSLNNKKYK